MRLQKSQLQILLENNKNIPQSYSGRNMFGKTCLSVITDNVPSFLINFGILIGEHNEDCYCHYVNKECDNKNLFINVSQAENVKMDNMGLEYVIYWPTIPFVDDEQD